LKYRGVAVILLILVSIGDTLFVHREQNAAREYDVMYEHYVYLGEFNAGDSLNIWYGSAGIAFNNRLLIVMDEAGNAYDTLASVHGLNWDGLNANEYTVEEDGKLLLYFQSLGGNFVDSTESVSLQLLVQMPGAGSLLDIQENEISLSVGDTLSLDSINHVLTPTSFSSSVYWEVPRVMREVINDDSPIFGVGNRVQANWLAALSEGTAQLVGISVADPTLRDTIQVNVMP